MAVRDFESGLLEDVIPERTWRQVSLDLMRKQPLGTAGAAVVAAMIASALFAEIIAPFDPEVNDFEAMLISPNWSHLLGTDEFGRDIFSRLVHGARTAMLVGFSAAFVGSTIGLAFQDAREHLLGAVRRACRRDTRGSPRLRRSGFAWRSCRA